MPVNLALMKLSPLRCDSYRSAGERLTSTNLIRKTHAVSIQEPNHADRMVILLRNMRIDEIAMIWAS